MHESAGRRQSVRHRAMHRRPHLISVIREHGGGRGCSVAITAAPPEAPSNATCHNGRCTALTVEGPGAYEAMLHHAGDAWCRRNGSQWRGL
ncbi:hypothetical protein PsYK624_015170 [Phanerochaete sordida]|uniref:Uncharacterized protein n=1 Tax=Phanerochaete sordida TaxID=48140 RepID=A0A9P3L8X4_9APHY|nr:hypothetical protein PsYK624_015170 [Phanerochaete sordida]